MRLWGLASVESRLYAKAASDRTPGARAPLLAVMARPWKPSVTVAAVVERDGRFLMVEEETPDGVRLNQPAGHLDPGESLVEAAAREAIEELSLIHI